MKLGFSFGHAVDKDRIGPLSESILFGAEGHPVWTSEEFRPAAALIPTDAKLSKEMSYARTVAPAVFALAKERFEVQRGRPLRYRQACRLASEHSEEIGEMFSVVRIEGIENPNGTLRTFWRIRPGYDPDEGGRAYRPAA